MVLTSSKNQALGAAAPPFALPDFTGRVVTLDEFASRKAMLVVFWSNHCPFVKHIKHAFAEFASAYGSQGLGIVAINSNDARSHPGDRPERMQEDAATYGFAFDYLIDETQDVARAYDAACTPDFFLFDRNRKLAYHGQFDLSRPHNSVPITGKDLRAAADAVLAGYAAPTEQTPSIGCNIKWRS
jgi:thiol-disulfide isomerase/thioredoxin